MTVVDYGAGASLSEAYAACTTALQTLQRLGESAAAEPLLDQAADDIDATFGAVAGNDTRSDSYKLSQYATLYTGVITTLARKLTAAANAAGAQDAADASNVLGIKGLAGDVASLAISRRDAADRASTITDPVQRQQLLEQAARTGDDCLSRALVASAMDFNDADTTNLFMSLYPDLAPAAQRLWDAAHRKTTAVDLAMGWRLAALKPAPLQPMMDYEIAAAAAGNDTAASWNV